MTRSINAKTSSLGKKMSKNVRLEINHVVNPELID